MYTSLAVRSQTLFLYRCHRDACFLGYRVSRTHIPRDACFPAHIIIITNGIMSTSQIYIVIYVSPAILFPLLRCEVAAAELCMTMM